MTKPRLWEVDLLRFIAIAMMIWYHILFFAWYVKQANINVLTGFWRHFAVVDAATFMTLVGVSLYLRVMRKPTTFTDILKRAGFILACSLLVTLSTGVYARANIVIFGVLHFVGLALIVAYPFAQRPYVAAMAVPLILGIYHFIKPMRIDSYALVWLGVQPNNFATFDYFPMIPWLAAVLSGIFLAHLVYPLGNRRWNIPDLSDNPFIRMCTYLGRNSLWIYLIHFPVLITILTFL